MINIKKWIKPFLIVITSYLGLIIALGIVFNQFIFSTLVGYGSNLLYHGYNQNGNNIIAFGLSHLDNPNADIYHSISVQNTKNGNYNIAIPALEKAYQLDPYEIGEYYGWVLLYYYHDYNKALEVLNSCDNLTPEINDFPMGECIHYLKGLAYKELGNYDKAIQEFDLSIQNEINTYGKAWVDHQIFLNKGISLYKKEEYREAIRVFNQTIRNNSVSSEAYYYLGLCYLKLDENFQACSTFNQAKHLLQQGHKSSETYVELFHEIYLQDVDQAILLNCK